MSDRSLDSDLQEGAESERFNYVVLVSLDFPTGTVRVHNGAGTYNFGGNDYLGVGSFGSISALEETGELVDNPIQLTLSAITPEIIDAIKTDDIYGRDVDVYLGALDDNDQLEGTPTNWISGYMEHASLILGEDNAVVIQIQTRAAKLKRRNNLRYTNEDHQAEFPGDRFFEFLPQLQEAEVRWGGERVRTGFQNDTPLGSSGNELRFRRGQGRGQRGGRG